MVKWIAFIMALTALMFAADRRKVGDEFAKIESRIDAIEGRKCAQ